jgi:hypothetical protein
VAAADGVLLLGDFVMDRIGRRDGDGTPSVRDRIRQTAMNAGIMPDDPLAPVLDALADLPDEVDLRIAPVLVELRTFATAVEKSADRPSTLTEKQVDELAKRLAQSCAAWSGGLVQAANRKSAAIVVAALAAVLVVGIGAGWWLHAPPSELACGDQADGSRICWMYTRLPTKR